MHRGARWIDVCINNYINEHIDSWMDKRREQ